MLVVVSGGLGGLLGLYLGLLRLVCFAFVLVCFMVLDVWWLGFGCVVWVFGLDNLV